jgi:hypothetical protein
MFDAEHIKRNIAASAAPPVPQLAVALREALAPTHAGAL